VRGEFVRNGELVRPVSGYPAAVEDKVAILRGIPLFADLDERSLQAVSILAHEVSFKAGDVLMVEGEAGDTFYVIIEGTVRVEQGDRTVRSLTAAGFLGEIALVERRPRTATATCVTDVRLLEVRAHEFERLLDTLPAVHERIRAAILRRERTARRTSI
jgi:CRP/FNR family transcriptional regulator, cyclic AMP receptor protein